MPIGKIGQRRQVVIPKEIFDALGLRTGDFVEVKPRSMRGLPRGFRICRRDGYTVPLSRSMR